MKAPDKIYVASYNGEAFSHSWTMEPLGDTTATEYIRKDVLLKWANNWLSFERSGIGLDKGFAHAMKIMIEKLNSM